MPRTDLGFAFADLPSIPSAVLDSYRDCPVVERLPGLVRFERLIQIQLSWTADDDWYFNQNNAAPGSSRIDFTSLLRHCLSGVWLDLSTDWLIQLRQIRAVVAARTTSQATPPAPARTTGSSTQPDVPHTAGTAGQEFEHEFALIAVLQCDRVAGGPTQLYRRGDREPFWSGILRQGQALLFNVRTLSCLMREPIADAGGWGSQDILIGTLSRRTDRARPVSANDHKPWITAPVGSMAEKPA